MSPLFAGGSKPSDARLDGVRSEVDRLRGLSLEQLAAEVFARGFDLDNNAHHGRTSVHDMALRMVPHYLLQSQDQIWELEELIGEGVQLLEHARLAQCTVVAEDRRIQWVLTRRGRQVAADGTVLAALQGLA